MTERVIPDVYTNYTDGNVGNIKPGISNIEVKIGAADAGEPYRIYPFSGPQAKKEAKTVLKGGPLLRAIEEAFDAGAAQIHAIPIGDATAATLTFKDMKQVDTLRVRGPFGAAGNNHYGNLSQSFTKILPGYAIAYSGDNRVTLVDKHFAVQQTITLPAEIATVKGVKPVLVNGQVGYVDHLLVLGLKGDSSPTLWTVNLDGAIDASKTVDLTGQLGDPAESLSDLVQDMGGDGTEAFLTTPEHLLAVDLEEGTTSEVLDYASDLSLVSPDIVGATYWLDIAAMMDGELPASCLYLLEGTGKKAYRVTGLGGTPAIASTLDLSGYMQVGENAQSISVDLETGDLLVGVKTAEGSEDKVLRLTVDWSSAVAGGSMEDDESISLPETFVGFGMMMADAEMTSTLVVQDRNQDPVQSYTYTANGTFATITQNLARAIEAGGVHEAEILVDTPNWLFPSLNTDGAPDPTSFTAFAGGADSGAITNEHYLTALELSKSLTEASWVDCVGATSNVMWTAILTHCREMTEELQAERFAFLRCPAFTTVAKVGSAEYITAASAWVDQVLAQAALVADRNAVIVAGGASFVSSDGEEYTAESAVAAVTGVAASNPFYKSLLNKPVPGVTALHPALTDGQITKLLLGRVNCLRFKPGRGFIIAHSLTAARDGSDYSRVEGLRSIYAAGKAAREGGQPYIGEPNDSEGTGLELLKDKQAAPVQAMVDARKIDSFTITIENTGTTLGQSVTTLGVKPLEAMEMNIINIGYSAE